MGVAFQMKHENIQKITQHIQRRLELAAEMVVGEAKRRCPVDTGNLRNSIEWGRDEESVIVGSVVEYAPYQELGFVHYRSGRFIQNAFLVPALLAVQKRIGATLA